MKRVVAVLAVAMFALVALPAASMAADAYPSKPITAVVPMAAGGSSDLLARAIEKFWPKYSKQPLVVVNKPGGGGVVGTEGVVRSKPDGYTLYLGYGSGHDVVMPSLQKMPYDPLKDLVPVSRVSIHSVVIVTGAKSQFTRGEAPRPPPGRSARATRLPPRCPGRGRGTGRSASRAGAGAPRSRAARGGPSRA